MPDPSARKRLKKKMLERWENEGGRVAADPTSADENRLTSKPKSEGKKLSAAREATRGVPESLAKRRKGSRK